MTAENVLVDPGTAVPLTFGVKREPGFDEAIDIAIADGPAGAALATNAVGDAIIVADPAAKDGTMQETTLRVTSRDTHLTGTAKFFLRIGHSLFTTTKSTSWAVPPDVTEIEIYLWGGGGGAGAGFSGPPNIAGGSGGTGGFAFGIAKVDPNESLALLVRSGGGGGDKLLIVPGFGGAGGGHPSVFRSPRVVPDAGGITPDRYLLIAGGGGGGGAASTTMAGGAGGGGGGVTDRDGEANVGGGTGRQARRRWHWRRRRGARRGQPRRRSSLPGR